MPGKSEKYFPYTSREDRSKHAVELYGVLAVDAPKMKADERAKLKAEYDKWSQLGIDPLETALIGPFTVKEFLKELSVELKSATPEAIMFLMRYLEKTEGLLSLEPKKNKNGLNIIGLTADTKAEMEKLNEPDGKYKLNKWDKFWGFFGYKTEHALSVEANLAGLQACREKQQELAKNVMTRQMEPVRDSILKNYESKYNENQEPLKAAKDTLYGWKKLFFGREDGGIDNFTEEFTLPDGKKVSTLSLCMAALQQKTMTDLSMVNPKELAEKLDNPENEKKRESIKEIGAKIAKMASLSNMRQLKFLDSHLNTGKIGIANLDKNLNNLLKRPGKEPKPLVIGAADAYFKADNAEKKNELYGQACAMLKMREDMTAIFGENDPVYGMKDAKGNPTHPPVEAFRNQAQKIEKGAALYEALQKNQYDVILKEAKLNDYNKLDEALNAAGKTLLGKESKRYSLEDDNEYNKIDEAYLAEMINDAMNNKDLDSDINEFSSKF